MCLGRDSLLPSVVWACTAVVGNAAVADVPYAQAAWLGTSACGGTVCLTSYAGSTAGVSLFAGGLTRQDPRTVLESGTWDGSACPAFLKPAFPAAHVTRALISRGTPRLTILVAGPPACRTAPLTQIQSARSPPAP